MIKPFISDFSALPLNPAPEYVLGEYQWRVSISDRWVCLSFKDEFCYTPLPLSMDSNGLSVTQKAVGMEIVLTSPDQAG